MRFRIRLEYATYFVEDYFGLVRLSKKEHNKLLILNNLDFKSSVLWSPDFVFTH
jgi:hypothetical protein